MMLKRFLVAAAVLCLSWPGQVWAQDALSAIEKNLFARDYVSDPLGDRLSRIETILFGGPQAGGEQQRQARIQSVFGENTVHTPDNPKAPAASQGIPAAAPPQEPAAPDATDYPTITQMEDKLFHHNYAREPLDQRLARLEKQVFQQVFEELPMVDRVDQLTLKVLPNNPLGVEERSSFGLPSTGEEFVPGNLAVYSQLTTLEEQILGKSYGGELLSRRLERLEHRVFGAPRQGSIDNRVSNLLSYYGRQARNQQQQHQQQPSVGQAEVYDPHGRIPSGLMRPSTPQQVMIGTMMGGSRQYSRDMLEMLPPNLRRQFEAYGTGTVVGTPQPPTLPPGFYNGPGTMTYQSDLVAPVVPNPLYTTPGQIRPYYYNYPGTAPVTPQQALPNNPMGFPGGALGPMFQNQSLPNYPGGGMYQNRTANSLNQSLIILEQQVFGRTFEGSMVGLRLNNLEQHVFGKTFPGNTFQDRINRLMRQTRFHQSGLPNQQWLGSNSGGLKGLLGQALNMLYYRQMYQQQGGAFQSW